MSKQTKQKTSGKSQRDEGKHEIRTKERKEPNQMESMASAATVWNGCSSQGRLHCFGTKTI